VDGYIEPFADNARLSRPRVQAADALRSARIFTFAERVDGTAAHPTFQRCLHSRRQVAMRVWLGEDVQPLSHSR
jgi:hypothetical protein